MLTRMGMITYVGSAEIFSARVQFYVFYQAEFVMQGWIEINERNGITVFVCIVELHSLYKKVCIGRNCLPLTNIVIDSLCFGSDEVLVLRFITSLPVSRSIVGRWVVAAYFINFLE